jgi:hypothetical protein
MQASLRWAGEGFRNLHPILPGLRDHGVPRPTISDFLRGGNRRVPAGPLPSMDPRAGWAKPVDSGLRATWLGHSTVLIEIDGYACSPTRCGAPRASPSRLAGPKRFQPVPVPLRALPPIDLVLLSHDHYDHLDYPAPCARWPRPACPSSPRWASVRTSEAFGVPRAHHRARLVGTPHACPAASSR